MKKRSEEDKANLRVMNLVESNPEGWADVNNLIKKNTDTAIRNCFDDKGEIADFERGVGHGLADLLLGIKAMVFKGRELLEKEQSNPEQGE